MINIRDYNLFSTGDADVIGYRDDLLEYYKDLIKWFLDGNDFYNMKQYISVCEKLINENGYYGLYCIEPGGCGEIVIYKLKKEHFSCV